jgi:RNA polymerase sigma-70 factor (ECF subfamily)
MQATRGQPPRPVAPDLPDPTLALAARQGSDEAFRLLVERWQRPVFALIVRLVRDAAAAEDLAQETFLKAHRALAAYDPERRFGSWLLRIAHNAAIDALRRRHPEVSPLLHQRDDGAEEEMEVVDDRTPTPEASALGRDLGRALQRALGELRAEHREALLLRFQEGLTYDEIAEVLGIPLGTVKTFIFRARQELARRLGGQGFDLPGERAGKGPG